MIALLVLAAEVGPALKLSAPAADGTPVIVALDATGVVATQIACPRNQWTDPEDSAARLVGSREVLATVVAKNGKLANLDDLGPAKFDCVLMPEEPHS